MRQTPPQLARLTRLIVLPFRMLRPDSETEFLAFSLPDALASSLGGLQSLVVLFSMAAARFAGDSVDPKTIGVEADVDVIVTGTLLRAGSEVRVATQLTDASNGTLLWSEAAQTAVGDMFRLQDELTRRILASLSLPLTVPASIRCCGVTCRRALKPTNTFSAAISSATTQSSGASHAILVLAMRRGGSSVCPGVGTSCADLSRDGEGTCRPAHRKAWFTPKPRFGGRSTSIRISRWTHKLFAQLEVDLGRGHDAMARLIERAHTADSELLAGLVSACRYCGLLEASVAAHGRALDLEPTI